MKKSPTYRRIYAVVARIPKGCVATYGQIAKLAGLGRHARQVGYALHATPEDVVIPWHRVINAQGRISFPPDSKGYEMQKSLLEGEGVVFLNGKTDLQRFGYEGALDRLVWGEPQA